MGDYAKAEPLYRRALAIREKALGPEHPDTADSLNNLAGFTRTMGDYAKAEPLYQRALAISEKALGPEHPDTATSLNNLARALQGDGRLRQGRTALQARLGDQRKGARTRASRHRQQPQQPGGALQAMGDYAKAEPLYQRALAIPKKRSARSIPTPQLASTTWRSFTRRWATTLKPNRSTGARWRFAKKRSARSIPTPQLASTTWRRFTSSMGDYAKAEPLYRRALAIQRKSARRGASRHRNEPQQPGGSFTRDGRLRQSRTALPARIGNSRKSARTGASRHRHQPQHLAELYSAIGDYVKAESLYRRALAISEKALGPEHPDTASSLNNLAELYSSMGDYAKAEPLYRRALAICEKALGPEHPDTAISFRNLAFLNIDLGKVGGALELAARAEKAQEAQLGNILSFTSEQQRLAFQEITNPFALVATLGSAPDIAQAVLHNKGVVLDSLLEDRLVAEASKDAKQRGVIDQLRAAKQGTRSY